MVNLSLTEKGGTTNELSFDKGEVTIGRVRGNDIVLPKGNVSKHHCRLVVQGDELTIEDLRSTNGTYVNGRKISGPTPVSQSDKIFVGDFVIRVLSAGEAELDREPSSSGPPEAGSLSSAIPRRPPPPLPPSRTGGVEENPGASAKATSSVYTPPPPPLPPAPSRRDSRPMPVVSEPRPAANTGTDINLDDDEGDSLSPSRPRIMVPPLKPAVQVAPPASDLEAIAELDVVPSTPSPHDDEALSALSGSDEEAPPPPPELADQDAVEPSAKRATTPAPATLEKPQSRAKPTEQVKPRQTTGARPSRKSLDRDVPEWIAQLLDGEGVTAVFLVEPNQAEVERHGQREKAQVSASDMAGLGATVRKLASKASSRLAPDSTVIDVTLPDGMHIAAIFPPVADRLCAAISRPIASGRSVDDLVTENVLSPQMHQVLDACVNARQNILISGDRAACDALLRAMLLSLNRLARVVLLSDSLSPPSNASSWIRLRPEAATENLVSAAAAMQPDYLVVDASQISLAADILADCDLGRKGVLLALVARSSTDALARLRSLAAKQGVSAVVAADMVAASIDLVVQASVLPDASLKIVEMGEPKESLDGQVAAHALLSWIPGDGSAGSFTASGARSRLAGKLVSAGFAVPNETLNRR